jgi:ABC-type uncharacterized transport system substrate-binding protein
MSRQLAMLFLSSAIALLANLAHAETLNVVLVMSDSTAPYQQFSTALNKSIAAELGKALAASRANVAITESRADSAKADLVVAVGIKATELAIAEFNSPVLAVMVPKASYEALLEKYSAQKLIKAKAVSAIYLDQPWERQLNFIQAALPKHGIVGMLYSPNISIVLPRLPQGMSINARSVRPAESLFVALEYILDSSDVLLVIPDSEIYSSSNMRNILLTSYRKKVPLVGISQAYVNAGALCAIYSTPEQLAWQAAAAIVSFATGKRLPVPQYPEAFSIGVNQQVANSLGIDLAPPEVMRQRMDKTGEGRR